MTTYTVVSVLTGVTVTDRDALRALEFATYLTRNGSPCRIDEYLSGSFVKSMTFRYAADVKEDLP